MQRSLLSKVIFSAALISFLLFNLTISPAGPAGAATTSETGFAPRETEITTDVEAATEPAQRAELSKANDFVKDHKFEEALKIIDESINYFEKKVMETASVYVCFTANADYDKFVNENKAKGKIVRIDSCFCQALHLKAFILASTGKTDLAMKYLEREAALAPCSSSPLCEMGYIYNLSKKSTDARAIYEKSLEMCEKYPASNPSKIKAAALRGLGFVYIEIGDLKKARSLYEDSLRIDPNNSTALQELEYISGIEKKKLVKRQPLMDAILEGNEAKFKSAVEGGADINMKVDEEITPLMAAAAKGRVEMVKTLLEKGASVDARDNKGWFPLMYAVEGGTADIVKLLIEKKADIRAATDEGYYPLFWAAFRGHDEIAAFLVEKGAELDKKTKLGFTPFLAAAMSGRDKTIKMLLDKGVNVNTIQESAGVNALMMAISGKHVSTVKLLIEKGIDVNRKSPEGMSPLKAAKAENNEELVEILKKAGAKE